MTYVNQVWMKLLLKSVTPQHTWMICWYMEKTDVKIWENIKEVISIIQNLGFKDNHDKIQLEQSEMKYSGTVLDGEGRATLVLPKRRT